MLSLLFGVAVEPRGEPRFQTKFEPRIEIDIGKFDEILVP
jgi:hypothetical protein